MLRAVGLSNGHVRLFLLNVLLKVLDVVFVLVVEEVVVLVMIVVFLGWFVLLINFQLLHSAHSIFLLFLPLCHLA